MPEEVKQPESISPEIQDVMRNLVSAIRAVKLYPSNNPIYAQSVHKAFESLDGYLQREPHFPVGVQKSYFLFEDIPVAKEAQINRGIAQDIFAKGIREIVFLSGVSEEELTELCKALALLPEEMAMRSGIVSILWEKSAIHIKVIEAALEEVITAEPAEKREYDKDEERPVKLDAAVAKRELHFKGRTLFLADLIERPREFGNAMVEIAQQTLEEGQTVEDRIHELYQEAGRYIRDEDAKDQEALFRGLARSVLEMDSQYRDKFISSKLYAHLDAERIREQTEGTGADIPEDLHEIVTGRFSKEWTVQQIVTLLKKTSLQQPEPKLPPIHPSQLEAIPISDEIIEISRELTEYTPEEMEALRSMSEVGNESDIIEAVVRTLIFLMPLVKNEHRGGPPDAEGTLFSGVVHQLETTLAYLLKNKDYALATIIVRAYHLPVDPLFRPRLLEAVKKASSREIINGVVADMRATQKSSPEYLAAYSYLTVLDQEATAVLLETLAAEKDRAIRRYLLDILKELGRNQIAKIGQRITDGRWYVVRNVVNILGESRSEEAIAYLEKVAGHPQLQIRHEVIKGLMNIGGKRAAGLLCSFLNDKENDIQLQAIKGLGGIQGVGPEEARALEQYLQMRSLNKREVDLSVEGIRSLGKIGDQGSADFLNRYTKLKWWRSRKLQEELRKAAVMTIDAIQRRTGNDGRAA
jgi:hypothetical protein